MIDADSGDSPRMSFWEALNAGCGTAADRRNQYWFVGWCLTRQIDAAIRLGRPLGQTDHLF